MSVLFATGFRPFFLLAFAHAAVTVALWGVMLGGRLPVTLARTPLWHAHEMLFGFAPAVVAGFLLTAVPHWTSTRALSGPLLVALSALWLLGRGAAWAMDPMIAGSSEWLWALPSLAFLPTLAIALATPIVRSGNHRNLVMPALLLGLFACQLLFELGGRPLRGATLALDLYLLMMLVIGGRITPLFTRNWLTRNGQPAGNVGAPVELDRIALLAVVVTVVLAQTDVPLQWIAWSSLIAGALQLARLPYWRGLRARRDPLVLVLHLGHAWIATAFLLRGFALLASGVPNRAWVHAAGVGAMGTLIVGMMTRVTLGHTGRPLAVPSPAWIALAAITTAAVSRVLVGMTAIPRSPWLEASALTWVIAFALFGLFCVPKLLQPRVDGRPG